MKSVDIPDKIKSLKVNEEFNLNVSVEPKAPENKVVFTVTPKGIVEVDEVGKITALKSGVATVKATVKDKSDTITINVAEE